MRLGVWKFVALTLGSLSGACAGGYPLPPTRCDDYCDATKGGCQDFYEPANCVSNCEQQSLGSEACRPALDAAIACFRDTPGAVADECDFSSTGPRKCAAESAALFDCSQPFRGMVTPAISEPSSPEPVASTGPVASSSVPETPPTR